MMPRERAWWSLFLLPVSGCAEGGEPSSFVFGWVVLGVILLFMLLLFAGIVRYVRAGRHASAQPPEPAEYSYELEEDDLEEEPPGGTPDRPTD